MSSATKTGCLGLLALISGIVLLVFGIIRFSTAWPLAAFGLVLGGLGAVGIRDGNRAADREEAETAATWHMFVLRYFDGTEVQVGDRVAYRRVFGFWRRELLGRVVYVPGQCAPHPELERDGFRWWCVEFDGGRTMAPMFDAHDTFIRRFRLIERGDPERYRLRPETEFL